MIKLGDKARDTITGYTGIVVADTTWLNGCRRLTLQAGELKDGKPIDSYCVDEGQLEKVEDAMAVREGKRGGPAPSPQRAPDPVR